MDQVTTVNILQGRIYSEILRTDFEKHIQMSLIFGPFRAHFPTIDHKIRTRKCNRREIFTQISTHGPLTVQYEGNATNQTQENQKWDLFRLNFEGEGSG